MTITEQLRRRVNDSADSRYAIAKATGIDQAALLRFANGGDAYGATLDKLADHFSLTLVERKPKKR